MPSAPSGSTLGTVTAGTVALRDKPSKDDSKVLKQISRGDQVIIFFQTGEWFYVEYEGKKYYAWAQYIKPDGSVPLSTPAS